MYAIDTLGLRIIEFMDISSFHANTERNLS